MKARRIFTKPKFDRQYRKLSAEIKERAKQREEIFRNNPFDPRLDTHKLKGKEQGAWSFWITGAIRIKFIFLNGGEVLFLEIGPHDVYK